MRVCLLIRSLMPALLLALGACAGQTPASNFYTLGSGGNAPSAQPAQNDLSVGLGPVNLPAVLERPQIVTRTAENRLELSEFDRWGGELSSQVTRVLSQRLMTELGTTRVASHPWPRYRDIDFQIVIDVFRFDGEPGGEVVLEGVWALIRGDGIEELEVYGFLESVSVSGAGYDALVAAHGEALGRLGAEIADRIRRRQ